MATKPIFVLVAVAAIGCSDESTRGKTQGPPSQALYTKNRDVKNERMREIVTSFDQFSKLSEFVKIAPTLNVYEGLPHDVWEPEAYENELKNANTVKFDGSVYYAAPIPVTPEVIDRLRALASSRSSFIPFQGSKNCGGFHSDWCLAWQNGDEIHRLHICFGCHELIAYAAAKRYLYCDIWQCDQLKALLDPLQRNRPKPREER